MASKSHWEKAIIKILKTELIKKEMTYKQLAEKLNALGIEESEPNIKNKLSRGTFGATFLLQCLYAMGVKTLPLDEAIVRPAEKNDAESD